MKLLPKSFFLREDQSPDEHFYWSPRLVRHIDDEACAALTQFYDQLLPENAAVLDLMSSWVSHLPDGREWRQVSGIGMNKEELETNPVLTDYLVRNLNAYPEIPYPDQTFDACLIAVSIQYLIQPAEVFKEIARVLVPGGVCCVSYSNRMFPTKAIKIWREKGGKEHAKLIEMYFLESQYYQPSEFQDISPQPGHTDPLYVVTAKTKDS